MPICDASPVVGISWTHSRSDKALLTDTSQWSDQIRTNLPAFHTSFSPTQKTKKAQSPIHILTKISQTLMYDYGTTKIFVSGTGDSSMNLDLSKSFASLSEIASLPDNWNLNGAHAFSEQVVLLCQDIVRFLSHQPDIFPTAQGSIQMEWDNPRGDYLEIEIFESGILEAAMRKNDGSWTEEELDVSMIGEYVERFFA